MHGHPRGLDVHAMASPETCFVCDATHLEVFNLFTARSDLWLLVFVLCDACVERGQRSGWSENAAQVTAAQIAALRVRWKGSIDIGR